jgi:4-hydroxy-L-threonine phosphate dehydrogenase PdxA
MMQDVTTPAGELAGIGPDIVLKLSQSELVHKMDLSGPVLYQEHIHQHKCILYGFGSCMIIEP